MERKLPDSTHCPYRPWCRHCVYGHAADYPHRAALGEAEESTAPRVMLDYCYCKEGVRQRADEHTELEEVKASLTALVLKETMCDSI